MAQVLIVDDELDIRRLVGHALAGAGLGVTEPASGGEALRLLKDSRRSDVLVLGLSMGIVSGWRLLEDIDRGDLRGDTWNRFESRWTAVDPDHEWASPLTLGDRVTGPLLTMRRVLRDAYLALRDLPPR